MTEDPSSQASPDKNAVRYTRTARQLYGRLRGVSRRFSRVGRSFSSHDDLLAREFDRRGPWVTQFVIDGRSYGGHMNFEGDERIVSFAARFPSCEAVLELGSLEGGQTFELARYAKHVTAVEARTENIERAGFVQQLYGVEGVSFVRADLERTPVASFGSFDAVFCSGLLYHLPRPWELIDQLPGVAPRVFMWTHYTSAASVEVDGVEGTWYVEKGRTDPLSGLSPRSFWMTLPSLIARLEAAGFESVDLVKDEPQHPHGPAITLAAWTAAVDP
jgi:SAM-dependent methyltransferase